MIRETENVFDRLLDHYVTACLFIVLFILTLTGVGDVRTVSMLGFLLCTVGLIQKSAAADLWILVPFLVYNAVSMMSSYAVYGNITDGYGSTHMIYPIMYLLMACLSGEDLRLLKRLCVCWAGITAAWGLGQFVIGAVSRGGGRRLSGLLGNPNAMGIFLVVGWFALVSLENEEENLSRFRRVLPYIEPLLFIALSLTLSLGSFVSMAAGILWYLAERKTLCSWKETALSACVILAKASLGFGIGVLMYLAACWTGTPASCAAVFIYSLLAAACWPKFQNFLKDYPKISAVMTAFGLAVAAVSVAIRPSSIATFAERLEMMKNGLWYVRQNPLLGVGPYQWRLLNMADSDKYFNTWHIHNALLHVGVEMGWIAMGMIAVAAARFFRKKTCSSKAGFFAYCVHNMMDTSFFYMGITALMLMTAAEPEGRGKKKIGTAAVRGIFGLSAAIFAWNAYCCVLAG